MIYHPLSGLPLTGKYYGVAFANTATTMTARARVAPIQPRTNAQVTQTLYLSQCAAYWLTLYPATRALWFNPTAPTVSAYNQFLAKNQLLAQWGYPLSPSPPLGQIGPAGTPVLEIYAEPDGFNTSLGIVADSLPPSPLELWIHLYVCWRKSYGTVNGWRSYVVFVGNYQATSSTAVVWRSFTAEQTANAGQWWYPESTDTTAKQSCGNSIEAFIYMTDQFGRPFIIPGWGPFYNCVGGILPGQIGPDFCPFQPGPPYPWPPSH
jgi:hypothetical protein